MGVRVILFESNVSLIVSLVFVVLGYMEVNLNIPISTIFYIFTKNKKISKTCSLVQCIGQDT